MMGFSYPLAASVCCMATPVRPDKTSMDTVTAKTTSMSLSRLDLKRLCEASWSITEPRNTHVLNASLNAAPQA